MKMNGKMRQDLYQELYKVEDSHWWHEHKRSVVRQLLKRFAVKGKVLDIGCGTGKILAELKENGWEVIGLDGEQEAKFWSNKRRVPVKIINFEKDRLPFGDNTFDAVLILDVLEHLVNESVVVKEIRRVLKKNGVVLVTVPAYPWLFGYWDKILGHHRRYHLDMIEKLLINNKLSVQFISFFFSLVLIPAVLVRIVKQTFHADESHTVSDFQTVPLKLISEPILRLYTFVERLILKKTKLPFGLSLVVVAIKR
jgi:SAM-dependent methyltransferase